MNMKERFIYGVRVRLKSESRLMKVMNFFIARFNKRFMTNYWTTIGKTVYAPYFFDKEIDNDDSHILYKNLLEHEKVHIEDYKKYGPWFVLTYLFPPFGLAYGRWHWERKAYLPEILALHQKDSLLYARRLMQVAKSLSGSEYLWTWPKIWIIEWYINECEARKREERK